ncbi:hypothetical protein EHEC07001_51200 [Escherichia coli]
MPGLISYVSSASFVNEMMELRQSAGNGGADWWISPGRGEG